MSKITYILASIALIGMIGAFIGTQSTRNLTVTADSSITDLWAHWKQSYGKVYASAEEEAHRLATFTDNYNFVMNWNADPTQTSSVGLNEFADLNTAEFGALKGCLSMKGSSPVASNEETSTFVPSTEALPASVDWRAQGAVTPVKNQGQCGSCWSFSTTGVLEGLNFIQNKNLLSFSEQQLVSCSQKYGNQGCNGGWPFWALEYTAATGIELESTYPYTAGNGNTGTCKFNKADVKYQNKGYANVTKNNEVAMATALVDQPISVCVEADQSVFQLYTGGVITSASCGTQLDHAIMAVGYDTTSAGQDYWIVKNSWGTSWGLAGYLYIAKSNSTSTDGICGIAMNVAVPN